MYHKALICKNAHLLTGSMSKEPELCDEFCTKCGSETVSECSSCGTTIRGDSETDSNEDFYFYSNMTEIPSYCPNCGDPYPWTLEKINALKEMIEFSELEESEKKEFSDNIELIASDNPRTNLAAMKIKRFAGKMAKDMWDGVAMPLIVGIASETAKKTMGL